LGKLVDFKPVDPDYGRMTNDIQPLIEHLSRSTRLPDAQARRVVEDVLAYFNETVDDFVIRRHAELQSQGVRNDAIFDQLAIELTRRPFTQPSLSKRQIRRLIYG